MPPRANWKGYLKLSLVTCPIALFPATSSKEKVSFHLLNGAKKIEIAKNCHKQIVEIMGNTCRELAKALQLLHLMDLSQSFLALARGKSSF